MAEPMIIEAIDEPAVIVTTGRGEVFFFRDDGQMPQMSALVAAVMATRLRWWADRVEQSAAEHAMGIRTAAQDPA